MISAISQVSVDFSQLNPNELYRHAFRVNAKDVFKFRAIAPNISSNHSSIIWILNLSTREVVWELEDARSSRYKVRGLREFDDEIKLSKGDYEVFFSTYNFHSGKDYKSDDFFEIIKDVLGGNLNLNKSLKSKYFDHLMLSFTGAGNSIQNAEQNYKKDQHIVYQAIKIKDHVNKEIGISVNKNTDFFIYAIGEIRRKQLFDYAWIEDATTFEQVWQFNYRNSSHAGGGRKNRVFNDKVRLKKGKYILHIISDDSHSYSRWNTTPPYDPDYWGITLWVKESQRSYVEKFDAREGIESTDLVSISKVGDDEHHIRDFQVKKASTVRIFAIGEGDRDMYDYGWIADAYTGEKVWEMKYRATKHAGGAEKNRQINEIISLPKGYYFLEYRSDDSHSYEEWNASPPNKPRKWGVSLMETDRSSKNAIREFDFKNSDQRIERIIRVKNDENESRPFQIEKDQTVVVYALGEGSNRTMFDYGYITNEKGRVIWEMNYRNTSHAGGGSKNRQVYQLIDLKKGNYTLHYVSDDSHSYNDWNVEPPEDERHWGISVYQLKRPKGE